MNNRKKLIIPICFLLIFLTIGITTSFLMSSNTKTNSFFIGSNESKIVETFKPPENIKKGNTITKDVKVKNTGSKSYIRMFVAVSDNNLGKKFTMNINTKDWSLGSDGYYYYNKVVDKGESTASLFDKLTFTDALKSGSNLKIICYSESVQAQGSNDVQSAFNKIR